MGPNHLEAPIRIKVIEEALKEAPFEFNYKTAPTAPPKEIKRVHGDDLYNVVKASQSKGGYTFTPDTIANKYTFQAALTAVGGSIQTAVNTYKNHSFAMLRPPGHHATQSLAMGFCFFNNIAIATQHLLTIRKQKKIAIIDIDNHHGNGTQDIFFSNPNVLYTSLHAAPNISFPGTGYPDEIGLDEGKGKTVNIPLPFKTGDDDYLFAFDTIIDPIVRQFNPSTILVSLGFDGLAGDPYGALGLSTDVFQQLGYRIGKLGDKLTNSKIGVFLEGGYNYSEMGIATLNFFDALLDPSKVEKYILNPTRDIQKIVYSVRSIQRNYWYAI